MSNVISFLERMGQDASLRDADQDLIARALSDSGVDAESTAAILGGDRQRLEHLLAARTNVVCGLFPGDDKDDEDTDDDGEGDKDDDEISARLGAGADVAAVG